MKINFILPAVGRSGGIDVVNTYVKYMSKEGCDVVIYKQILATNMHRYNFGLKNILHRAWCTSKALIGNIKKGPFDQVVMKISENSIRHADVTIATSWPTAFEVSKLPEQCGRKFYFIQGYEVWDNMEWGQNSYKLSLNKIVISTWINNKLRNELNIGPFPVVFNGLDTEIFNTKGRREHERITFLMLNHTLEKKGVSQGLQVFKRIHEMYPNARLRMFGMCSSKNLPSYIEYFQDPSRNELVSLYKETDVFIFPSLEEGWGLTPLEAMACGCVVVGTRTGFVLDLGKHRENMMISEPGDVNGMVSNVIELMDNPELLGYIQTQVKSVIEQLDWIKSSKKFLMLLNKVVKDNYES